MPIYEYACICGQNLERYRSMAARYDVLCPNCGKTPQIKISLPSQHKMCMTFTVLDGNGRVMEQRHDHRRTPMFDEYYGARGDVMQGLHHGQEMAAKEMTEELKGTGKIDYH